MLGKLRDPLRIFSSLAILGDICIILSGGYFYNPIRSGAAILGLSTHALGVIFGSKRRFWLLGKHIALSDLVMSIIVICALLYILSGSNLLAFEAAPRYSEMIMGTLIGLGATCIILSKPALGSTFFTIPPVLHIAQAVEAWATQGTFDLFQLFAGICFFSSGIAARYIKKPEPVAPPL